MLNTRDTGMQVVHTYIEDKECDHGQKNIVESVHDRVVVDM